MRFRRYTLILIFLLVASCASDPGVIPLNEKNNRTIYFSPSDTRNDTIELNLSLKSSLPLWSSLTDFEIQTLTDLSKAKDGDPNALLALSILASGDVRDLKTYQEIKAYVDGFIEDIRPRLTRAKTVKRKGQLLHNAMHQVFLMTSKGKDAPGYSYHQSKLTGIFLDKKYNCISSALLYIILARYFDLNVDGVMLPDHVFVQLTDENGKVIEIETTTRTGYNLLHDKKFYKKNVSDWFHLKDTPTTYEEYLKRKILRPYQVIAANMNNQHTSEKRMGAAARFRLSEIRAYITKNKRDAQYNRLTNYNNLIINYEKKKETAVLISLLEKLEPEFIALRMRWQKDEEMLNLISWMEYYELNALQESGHYEIAKNKQMRYVKRLYKNLKDIKVLSSNHIYLMNQYLNTRIAEKRFAAAEIALKQFNDACRNKFDLNNLNFWLYSKWALNDWDYERWEKAVAKFTTSLKYAKTSKAKKQVTNNLEGAYYNWSISFSNRGNYRLAALILEKGLREYPDMEKLKDFLAELKKR